MSAAAPEVSVVVRSYNRYEALAELLGALLAQKTTRSFEVVVVDQTTRATDAARARLAELARDPRVRLLPFPPLGGPRARNEGVRATRGALILLIDDDDLPDGDGWIDAHAKNFDDPHVVAVTGGERLEGGRQPPYRDMDRARRLVLSLSPLMWQRIYCRVDVRKEVESLRGSNVALRRSLIERVGLWDEGTPVEDELSFCYRLRARRQPGEKVLFDPEAQMLRRMNIPGGMDKRRMTPWRYAERHFTFFHAIVAHYHPLRFWLLYPAYVGLLLGVTTEWLWDDREGDASAAGKLATLGAFALSLPFAWLLWGTRLLAKRIKHGPAVHEPRLDPAT